MSNKLEGREAALEIIEVHDQLLRSITHTLSVLQRSSTFAYQRRSKESTLAVMEEAIESLKGVADTADSLVDTMLYLIEEGDYDDAA